MVSFRAMGRGVRRLAEVVLIVVAARHVLGVWISSVILTGWGLWAGLGAWSRMEHYLDRRSRALAPDVIYHRPSAAAGPEHVTFARGLAAVSAAYLDHCEQEASQP